MSAGRLAGKVAIVTGAASGIGRAISCKFANEGANVLVVDKREDRLSTTQEQLKTLPQTKHSALCGDVSSSQFAGQLFSKVNETYGKPGDILVNCAGIIRDNLFINMKETEFDEVIQINLKSVFVITSAFVSTLKHPGGMNAASIINISSIVGKGGNAGQANYAASKAGVIGFTKSVGIELGRFGIRCNAVLPGFIETAMTKKVPPEILKKIIPQIPMKRMGSPEEVAKVCLFLASDESSYINCATLEVTGGLMA